MNHEARCTHVKYPDEKIFLKSKMFDVNMRLFNCNESYRHLILQCCNYISLECATEREGYKKPHGFSGANAGIPWNIIAVMHDDEPKVMINPRFAKLQGGIKIVESNCGSLTLDNPVRVCRYRSIDVTYYSIRGGRVFWANVGPKPGYTIQHEIEHNLGILITDQKEILREYQLEN